MLRKRCRMEENYMKTLIETESRSKSNVKRLDKIEENQKILLDMSSNIKVIAEQNKNQNEKIDTLTTDVRALKETPKKRYDLIVSTLITVVVTALVTAFVAGAF